MDIASKILRVEGQEGCCMTHRVHPLQFSQNQWAEEIQTKLNFRHQESHGSMGGFWTGEANYRGGFGKYDQMDYGIYVSSFETGVSIQGNQGTMFREGDFFLARKEINNWSRRHFGKMGSGSGSGRVFSL